MVRVEGSTSKAQNVNAVLHLATGEFTGMFDADHEPRPGSFDRAWRWLANGYDVVQGHCLTRNGDASWLARMIAVEFESIYAVAHPGRARLHRFGVFGGSNGYWRTELLHETRMRGSMLTEDIDSSMRVVERGFKIRSDRDIVSRELGTTTFKQTWNQRMRWSQGWFQVTMQHTSRVLRTPHLTWRQKVGASYLLGYRELYPWLSLQVMPLVAYWLMRGDALSIGWPLFFFSTVFVLHIGPMQTWFAYRLADPEIKQHKRWFVAYLVFSTFFYTEYKNTIARVSHIKEWAGERSWRVTPRGDDPVDLESIADPDDVAVGTPIARSWSHRRSRSGAPRRAGRARRCPARRVGATSRSNSRRRSRSTNWSTRSSTRCRPRSAGAGARRPPPSRPPGCPTSVHAVDGSARALEPVDVEVPRWSTCVDRRRAVGRRHDGRPRQRWCRTRCGPRRCPPSSRWPTSARPTWRGRADVDAHRDEAAARHDDERRRRAATVVRQRSRQLPERGSDVAAAQHGGADRRVGTSASRRRGGRACACRRDRRQPSQG